MHSDKSRRANARGRRVTLGISPRWKAPLAQLDRASGYEPEGREFESLRAHHIFPLDHSHLQFIVKPSLAGNTGEQVKGFQLKTQTSFFSPFFPEAFIIGQA